MGFGYFSDLVMVSTSEEYRANNVKVIVEWMKQEDVSYNVSIVPQIPIISTGTTSIHLTVLYNTEYNMSVEATSLCQNRESTHIQLSLFYGELTV